MKTFLFAPMGLYLGWVVSRIYIYIVFCGEGGGGGGGGGAYFQFYY